MDRVAAGPGAVAQVAEARQVAEDRDAAHQGGADQAEGLATSDDPGHRRTGEATDQPAGRLIADREASAPGATGHPSNDLVATTDRPSTDRRSTGRARMTGRRSRGRDATIAHRSSARAATIVLGARTARGRQGRRVTTSRRVTIDRHARVMRSGRTGHRVKIGHRWKIGRGGRIGLRAEIDRAVAARRRSGVPVSTAATPGVREGRTCPVRIADSAVDRFVSRASRRPIFSSRARSSSPVAGL